MNIDIEKLKNNFNRTKSTFEIVEMTEVYRTDDDGVKSETIGYFRKENIARAFAGAQEDKNYHKTEKVTVLTDGAVAYLIDEKEPLKIFDDEKETLALKEKAIAKLSPDERVLLGFN